MLFLACPERDADQSCTMSSRRGSGTRDLSEVRRVLIVDDNHDSAELIALVLDREGHETRVAYDPHEAIPIAVQFRPNVAFLDIGLPGMRRLRIAAPPAREAGVGRLQVHCRDRV